MLELRRGASWLPGKKAGSPMTHSDPEQRAAHRTHPADHDDGHQAPRVVHGEELLLVGIDSTAPANTAPPNPAIAPANANALSAW